MWFFGEPAKHDLDVLTDFRLIIRLDQKVAAFDVKVVVDLHDHGHWVKGGFYSPRRPVKLVDPGGEAGRQVDNFVAGLKYTAGHLAGDSTVIRKSGLR